MGTHLNTATNHLDIMKYASYLHFSGLPLIFSADWSYQDQPWIGDKNPPGAFCDGKNQSPININTQELRPSIEEDPISATKFITENALNVSFSASLNAIASTKAKVHGIKYTFSKTF